MRVCGFGVRLYGNSTSTTGPFSAIPSIFLCVCVLPVRSEALIHVGHFYVFGVLSRLPAFEKYLPP